MKLKDKIKSYSFWVSLTSAVILILKVLGTRFGFTVDEGMISDIFTALCSVLVLLGIIVVPNNTSSSTVQDKLCEENENTVENIQNKSPLCNEPLPDLNCIKEETITQPITNNNTSFEANNLKSEIEIDDKTDTDIANNNEINSSNTQDNNIIVTEPLPVENNNALDKLVHQENNIDLNEIIYQEQSTEDQIAKLKETFESERCNFRNNLNDYILALQEEIKSLTDKI